MESFKKRCAKKNIFVTVHHHWNYTDLINKIENAQIKYNLGEPVGIRFIGGAVCLSTNGTHYFDLGCKILKSSPKEVSADLELDYINPRDKNLLNIPEICSPVLSSTVPICLELTNFFNPSNPPFLKDI